MTATITFSCKNGHKVTVPANEGEQIAFTACRICWKPLFPKVVKA